MVLLQLQKNAVYVSVCASVRVHKCVYKDLDEIQFYVSEMSEGSVALH